MLGGALGQEEIEEAKRLEEASGSEWSAVAAQVVGAQEWTEAVAGGNGGGEGGGGGRTGSGGGGGNGGGGGSGFKQRGERWCDVCAAAAEHELGRALATMSQLRSEMEEMAIETERNRAMLAHAGMRNGRGEGQGEGEDRGLDLDRGRGEGRDQGPSNQHLNGSASANPPAGQLATSSQPPAPPAPPAPPEPPEPPVSPALGHGGPT